VVRAAHAGGQQVGRRQVARGVVIGSFGVDEVSDPMLGFRVIGLVDLDLVAVVVGCSPTQRTTVGNSWSIIAASISSWESRLSSEQLRQGRTLHFYDFQRRISRTEFLLNL
jgi:hypothetical protein